MLRPTSEKGGIATSYVNKKWVACGDTKAVLNNRETQHVYVTVQRAFGNAKYLTNTTSCRTVSHVC